MTASSDAPPVPPSDTRYECSPPDSWGSSTCRPVGRQAGGTDISRWSVLFCPPLALYFAARDLLNTRRVSDAERTISRNRALVNTKTFYQTGLQRGLEAYSEDAGNGMPALARGPSTDRSAQRYLPSARGYFRNGGFE